ncbi:MAG: hydroxyacid dehydrogenase [Lentimicrobiaceae bacterium]|nr:hydroxyacid dehydrogenase [Lentimicrobiaceae bacterium]
MKIVFLESLGLSVERIEDECKTLEALGHEVVIYADRCPEKNAERAADADIVVESNMPLHKDFFDACPNLKMLSIAFTGLDHIDLNECERRGIIVKNAAGYSTEAVAEEAICMMIGLYRHVIENDRITRSCTGVPMSPGREIAGKIIGVIGLGAIGQRTAKLAQAFGCNVIAWNRTPRIVDGVTIVDKETLFKEADIVTIHIALNDETRDFVTAKELALMKRSSIIVNAARGPVVNAQDLSDALKEGRISGAALDVYDVEPPLDSNNPMLDAPNTILLPHIGFATKEAFELRLGIVVNNVEQFCKQ